MSALSANGIATAVTGGQGNPTSAQLAMITAGTTLLSGGIAAALGQNVTGAVNAAENETLNNTCAAGHNCGTLSSALKDTGRALWNTGVGVVQSVPNFLSGSLPGYPDYKPFLSNYMLPYDDPDFGSLVSFAGAVAGASLAGSSGAATVTSVAAAGEARASASSSIVTAGDVDLANVYSAQVQGKYDPYGFYMQQAQSLDISTAPNTAVFYSGPGNRALAEQFAAGNGMTTLEMTSGGRWLDQQALFGPESPLTAQQAVDVWSALSQRYAAGASGNVLGFAQGARPTSIFNTVEFPTLMKNPNVTNVITGGH